LALHKKYTVSSAPNYALTSPDPNQTLLTDGVYTSDPKFWISKTTVGWQSLKKLTIEIDLAQSSPISKVSFNTVRGNAGVEFPQDIFVFTSTDQKNYAYIGDAASDPDNVHGAYEVKKFTLSNINRTARYVKFVIIPKGAYVFCDEIEVNAGNSASKDGSGQLTANTDIVVDSLVKSKKHVQAIAYRIKNMSALLNNNSNNESPEDMVASLNEQALNAKLSSVRAQWAANLRNKFSGQFVIDKVSPWQSVTAPYQPKGGSDNSYNITVPVNGVEYGAFVVTNLQTSKQAFTCQFSGAGEVSDPELFAVPFVTSGRAHNEIADPLVPVTGSVDLDGGESRMFVFKIVGKKAGQAKAALKIQSGTSSANLSLNVNVVNASFGSDFSLNANVWAYLNYPLVADRQAQAIADLHDHHVNTMIVPPNVLPVVGRSDFSKYNNYIAQVKSFKNIFIFMNLASGGYKNSFKTVPFLSDQWKSNFVNWYGQIVQGAQAVGISASQLYLYPYDEVRGADVVNSTNFLSWLRQAHPEIKTFGTLVDQTGTDKIMPLLTISQLLKTMSGMTGIANANASAHDLWVYETDANSEALPAYTYYRLLSWQSFVYGLQGVGFWDYADATGKLELDQYDGVNTINYSVIYHGPGQQILSSRRWEAFKLGIEDFELLKRYAQKHGMEQAKQLAQSVLDQPDDLTKADAVRAQILQSL
jgi:hypothetical protein